MLFELYKTNKYNFKRYVKIIIQKFVTLNTFIKIYKVNLNQKLSTMKNSKFKIQNSKFKIQNSKFKIFNFLNSFWVFGFLLFVGCQQNQDADPITQKEGNFSSEKTGMAKLGKKKNNPYSVTNMTIAFDNLKKSNARINTDVIEISTTHLYIKFKPKSYAELDILKSDSTLILFSYPLDYEVSEGSYYHDPSIPDSLPTYQYCSLPIDKPIPTGVAYEVLENLYIPDEYKDNQELTARKVSDELISLLVEEALIITDNLPDSLKTNARTAFSIRMPPLWTPAGTVRVYDNTPTVNNWRPVTGAIVRATRWFTTHEGMVDANGNFSCNGRFRYECDYNLKWERHEFALRDGFLDGASFKQNGRRGNWDVALAGNKDAMHAFVFLAALHYYYLDIKGLRRPPQNDFWNAQMRIRCHVKPDENALGDFAPNRKFLGMGNPINVYNADRNRNGIYATTIHELAHASHWNMSNENNYRLCDDIVQESWANGVEVELTKMVSGWSSYDTWYGRRKEGNYENTKSNYNYTGIVKDLIDNDNSRGDNVSGYTIRQIEDALQNQRTWDNWKNNIKNRYANTTKNNLDDLFNYWN
jgi:hypothetical protein